MSRLLAYANYKNELILKESQRAKKEAYDREQLILSETAKVNALGNNIRESSENYFKFRRGAKDILVVEALNKIFKNSIPLEESVLKYYNLDLMDSYVQENTGSVLINKFKSTSSALSELALIIENAFDEVMDGVDEKDIGTHIMDAQALERYDNVLSNVHLDTISSKISGRVQDSINNFFDNNNKDKAMQEEILTRAKEKALSQDTEEKAELIMNEAKKALIKSETYRQKSILEVMINESAIKALKESEELNEDPIDMETIFENTVILYTFMETLNTLKLENMNEAYISKVLNTL